MRGALRHPVRVLWRLATFLGVTGTGIADHLWNYRRTAGGVDPRQSAHWLQVWSWRTLSRIGIDCQHCGPVPQHGLVVCNHLSYLDIPVLAVSGPMLFVSKAEVQHWPFLGTLARCGGTLFLKREARGHVAEIANSFRPIVEGGTVVTLFPEGTSSGGEGVLPFRSSLLEPAATHGWPVTPAWITYEVTEGTVSEDVAYWRDMTFATHFLNLLSKRRIVGRVHYGVPVLGIRDRKELSRHLHLAVNGLMQKARTAKKGVQTESAQTTSAAKRSRGAS
jgi:1-acyl-sn-glycerol-3-phosphate acyltransferase